MKGAGTLSTQRGMPCTQAAFAIAFVALLALAGCEHAPAPQSQPVTKDQQAQQTPTPAPVEAPVPAQPLPAGPRFAVQVAACEQRPEAEGLASRLSELYGLQTVVAPVEVSGKTFYRVRLLVKNKEQAESLARTFNRTENHKAWIVTSP